MMVKFKKKEEKDNDFPNLDQFMKFSKIMMYGSYSDDNWNCWTTLYRKALDEYTDDLEKNMIKEAKKFLTTKLWYFMLYSALFGFLLGCILTYCLN